MLELGLLIFFGGMALRISKTLRDEAVTLEIYELPRTLHVLVFLFPVGPSILFYGSFHVPLALSAFTASLCYVPVLIIARRQARKLQTAGTDRVAKAESAISEAFGVALVGVIVVVAVTAIAWGAKAVAPGA
jgi:hypothetical protein